MRWRASAHGRAAWRVGLIREVTGNGVRNFAGAGKPGIVSTIQHLERFFGVGSAQNQQALFCVRAGGLVAVFDVDFGSRESMGDLGQRAGLIVAVHHQHIVFDDKCAVLFEQ